MGIISLEDTSFQHQQMHSMLSNSTIPITISLPFNDNACIVWRYLILIIFSSANLDEVTIGLNDMVQEGHFVWTDGSPVDFVDWGEGQPDQKPGNGDLVRITSLNGQLGWHDAGTTKRYSFLCASDTCPPGEMHCSKLITYAIN